ncbi:MAG: AAA family ATPase, partial [Turicibacter sp.]|nr:AAA family ATPase [Turicibacter sp.]
MTIFDKIASSKPLDTRKIESIELNLKDTSSKKINEEVSFVLSKITIIKNHLNQCFLEREDAINNLFITLTTGSNLLLLGPPGTGKSQLITELTKHIEGARMFSWLLNRTS